MDSPFLQRSTCRVPQIVNVLDNIPLQRARVHECTGRAQVCFAMLVAARLAGPVFWIAPEWQRDALHPDGMRHFTKPQNFTFINPKRPEDILWSMEEALRCAAVPLVVAELQSLPGLTAVRRLHLAAEHNAKSNLTAPLGLLLTAGTGGAPGVESRWQMEPNHSVKTQRWQLVRTLARTAPVKKWEVVQTRAGLQLQNPRTKQALPEPKPHHS